MTPENGSEKTNDHNEACEFPAVPRDPELVKKILTQYRTVAVVGISKKEDRDSHRVAAYLKNKGFKIVPVNPAAGMILGEKCYKKLADIPFKADVVDVFRKPSALMELAGEIIEYGPRSVWFQIGVVNNEASQKIIDAGIEVVQNMCMMVEHKKLAAD